MVNAGLQTQTNPEVVKGLPQSAAVLAYVGALPLVVAALMVVASPTRGGSAGAFMALYGGLLIAFFGGVRWGIAVMKPDGPTMRALIGAAAPLALAVPIFGPWAAEMKLVYSMVVLALLLIDDLGATRRGAGAPDWYLGVRLPLTVLIEVALLVALAAGARG